MNSDSLIVNLLVFAAAAWFLKQWITDTRAAGTPEAHPKPLPGAAWCPKGWLVVAAVGAVLIVAIITAAEQAAGVADQQSTMTPIDLLPILGAAIIEELVFRGWIVIDKKGTGMLIGSCIGVSLIFALGHPFLWETETGLSFKTDAQPLIAGAGIFVFSLFAYALRFMPQNPKRSLLPCFVAHAVHNLAVFASKAATGHVDWTL